MVTQKRSLQRQRQEMRKLFGVLIVLCLLLTSNFIPVFAVEEGVGVYIQPPNFQDSVYVLPKTTEETLVQTGTVYATQDVSITKDKVKLGTSIGIVFKAQNKKGLLSPTGSQKEDYVPNLNDGPLRETCVIPLGEGEIWVLSGGKKKVISVQTQTTVRKLLEYLDKAKLREKLAECKIPIGKMSELELLECEQIAIIELLENTSYEAEGTIPENKRKVIEAIKKLPEGHTKIPTEAGNKIQIEKLTETELKLTRKPNENEVIYINNNGKETRVTEQVTKLEPNTSVYGYLRTKVACYLKDTPDMRNAEGTEKECRDSIGMNYVGLIDQTYKQIQVNNGKFEYLEYTSQNDMLETNKFYVAEPKLRTILFCLYGSFAVIVALYLFLEFRKYSKKGVSK